MGYYKEWGSYAPVNFKIGAFYGFAKNSRFFMVGF